MHKSNSKLIVLGFVFRVSCFMFLVSILSGCSVVGSTKPAALQVTSTPEASVFLDGKHLGKTPFFSDQLKPGEHFLKISVSETGYSQNVKLIPGSLTVVNRDLHQNEQAQTGETLWLEDGEKGLFISSIPTEAEVRINDKQEGKTPLYKDDIKEGEYKILLTKNGFQNREFSVKISKNSRLMAQVSLASEFAKSPQEFAPSPIPIFPKVKILPTPPGFLRVRREASLSSPEIGRVNPNEEHELLQETENWYKIQFEGKQGWISSQYAEKI